MGKQRSHLHARKTFWAIWENIAQRNRSYVDFLWKQRICWKIPCKKLDKKHLDLVVANNLKVEGAGFGVDTNVVTLITREGARELPKMTKEEVAGAILDEIVE